MGACCDSCRACYSQFGYSPPMTSKYSLNHYPGRVVHHNKKKKQGLIQEKTLQNQEYPVSSVVLVVVSLIRRMRRITWLSFFFFFSESKSGSRHKSRSKRSHYLLQFCFQKSSSYCCFSEGCLFLLLDSRLTLCDLLLLCRGSSLCGNGNHSFFCFSLLLETEQCEQQCQFLMLLQFQFYFLLSAVSLMVTTTGFVAGFRFIYKLSEYKFLVCLANLGRDRQSYCLCFLSLVIALSLYCLIKQYFNE